MIFARRLIAQRCLYGVDRNPVAVDLAKVSLWLVTLAKDHALTFVDHALRHGDSLVGLSRRQIEAFHWDPDAPRFPGGFETMRRREHVAKVTVASCAGGSARRTRASPTGSCAICGTKRSSSSARCDSSEISCWRRTSRGRGPKERETKRGEYASAWLSGEAEPLLAVGLRSGEPREDQPLAPFHWEIEFPEVFDKENPGFDAMVGNPPFLGGTMISAALGENTSRH